MTSSISIASTIWISHHCWFLHGLFATESGTTATHCKSAVIHYLVCYYFLYLIWFCGSCGVSSDSIISHFVVVCWQAGTNTDGYAHMNLRFTHKTTTIVYMCNVFRLLSIVVVVVAVFVVVAYVFFYYALQLLCLNLALHFMFLFSIRRLYLLSSWISAVTIACQPQQRCHGKLY